MNLNPISLVRWYERRRRLWQRQRLAALCSETAHRVFDKSPRPPKIKACVAWREIAQHALGIADEIISQTEKGDVSFYYPVDEISATIAVEPMRTNMGQRFCIVARKPVSLDGANFRYWSKTGWNDTSAMLWNTNAEAEIEMVKIDTDPWPVKPVEPTDQANMQSSEKNDWKEMLKDYK